MNRFLLKGLASVFALAVMFGTVSCSDDDEKEGTIAVSAVAVNPTTAAVKPGATVTLSATVTPEDATDKTITWSSSDEKVATVDGGKVTGVAEGTATITATTKSGDKTATCTVTVSEDAPAVIEDTLEGNITADRTISAANKNFLKGFVYVKSGATLTIEAGSVIKGISVASGERAASLIIEPGAKIIAEGTVDKPIRVVLDTPLKKERSECWQVYSIITDMYQPNPNRMKDWISIPKTNGYESLHITVMGPQNKWVEVQIRTRRMDEIAERGLAAHWKYKGVKAESGLDEFLNTVRAALEEKENNPLDLMQDFKMDLYKDEIYVFTPTGELIKLAKGATVLDFAFAIHSKLGCKCVSAKVNEKNVPIKYVLNNGDTVSVVTSPTQTPKRDWLNIVVTSKARVKIKQALREETAKAVDFAKEMLQRRFKNRKIEMEEPHLMRYIKKKGFKTVTDFYIEIAEERLDPNNVIDEYQEFVRKETETNDRSETRSAGEYITTTEVEEISTNKDVLVIDKNLTGIEYKLAKCCNPIYGDEVFGFVSTQGIKIHRMDCPNAQEMFSRFGYRIIRAKWSGKGDNGYVVTLRVVGRDDIAIVTNITSVIGKENGVTLRSLNIDSVDGIFQGNFAVLVRDTNSLNMLVKKIKSVKGVKTVDRLNS